MPTEPRKPLIVISYAHTDEPEHPAEGEVKWLSFVTGYLRPAIKQGAVDLWIDRLMPGGADWEREIERKLRACDIFILLVSRHSLSSDYVVDKEIAIIRERQAKGEDVHFYPLVLTPTPKIALDLVRDKNLRPRDGKPFSDYSINDRYRHMSDTADEIADIAQGIAGRMRLATAGPSAAPAVLPIEEPDDPEFRIVDEQSLRAWLERQTREVAVTISTRAALRLTPLASSGTSKRAEFVATMFRAVALGRVAGKYPTRVSEYRGARDAAHDAASALADAYASARRPSQSLAGAARAAAYVAAAPDVAADAAAARTVSVAAAAPAATALAAGSPPPSGAAASVAWDEVRHDAATAMRLGADGLADAQLWSRDPPQWAQDGWVYLRAALPTGDEWGVWLDWYEDRLRGVSRGEAYELAFVNVPKEEWDKGPAAANRWIREHLSPRAAPGHSASIRDPESLRRWLEHQAPDVAVAIAVRSALRAAPLAIRGTPTSPGERLLTLGDLATAIYRANAFAWVSARYPSAVPIAAAVVHAAAAFAPSTLAPSALAAANAAARAAVYARRTDVDADIYAPLALAVANAAALAADAADAWGEISIDIEAIQARGANGTLDAQLSVGRRAPLGAGELGQPQSRDVKGAGLRRLDRLVRGTLEWRLARRGV